MVLSNIIGWGCLFGFLFSFWSRLVLNCRCGWLCFGCTYLLMYPLRWCWLWESHPLIWYMRQYCWWWHLLSLHREVNMWQSRCWSYNWKNDSRFFGGSSKEFYYLTSTFLVLSPYYSDGTTYSFLKYGKNVCLWVTEIIRWCYRL